MFWIVLLVIVGLVLYFAELVLLPGITLAAVGAFCALTGATAWAFSSFGAETGFWVLGISLVCVVLITVIFLRPKTWKKLSLNTEIKDSVGGAPLNSQHKIGDMATALTRLAPMGNVIIDGNSIEAKTRSGYIDAGSNVRIIGFENQTLIVEPIK